MNILKHTLLFIAIIALLTSCGQKEIVTDPQRPLLFWSPPENFKPSYITMDQDSVYWGLFVSQRYSAKYNLWTVKSTDRQNWIEPILIDNAYYFNDLDFEVRNDSLYFVFYEIAPEYFPDHGLGLSAFVDFKDELELSYSLKDLTYDQDNDKIPDNIEKQLLTSPRLPDTDLDGKPDRMDYNPLAKPRPATNNMEFYTIVLRHVIQQAGLDTITIKTDSAWTKFFGIHTLREPHPLYISIETEAKIPEITGFHMPLITVKTPLWFGSRQEYYSISDEIIPHLNFTGVEMNLLRTQASVFMQNYKSRNHNDNFRFVLEKVEGDWQVVSTQLIVPEEETKDQDSVSDSTQN